jgi:flavin reductase (DIM6/NTAB) family NADH-FMN oxidoreductase RutF
MDGKEFRQALGRFSTGVCLITVNDRDSGALALTANSFSSVSLDPPLVLWSIQNNSEFFREYTENEHFAFSVLASDQAALSGKYARRGEHAVEPAEFSNNTHDVPLLNGAIAHFSCRLFALHEAGDHHIIVGEVLDFQTAEGAPLLFSNGQYDELASVAK